MVDARGALLRPAIKPVPSGRADEEIRPFLEDAVVRERRRAEEAAELLREYEAEHGVVSDEELRALDAEWLA